MSEEPDQELVDQYARTIISLQSQLGACMDAMSDLVYLVGKLVSDRPPSSARTANRLLRIRRRLYRELTPETKTNSGAYLARVKDDQ